MRILLSVILLLAFGWSTYWYVGSSRVEAEMTRWLELRAEEGWVAEYASLETSGFPNRFDTTLTDLTLADPQTGLAWSVPIFQILALSYRPHHVIAVWPETQIVSSPNQNIDVVAEKFLGSVKFFPGISLALNESTIELSELALASSAGWTGQLESGQVSFRATPAAQNSYDVYFGARNMTLPERIRAMASETDLVSDRAETLVLRATLRFTAPWDRYAIEVARPQITAIDLELAQGTWGKLDLQATGSLNVDEAGIPTGEISVRATNWREILGLGRNAGIVTPQLAPLIESGLSMVARLSGNPNTIDAPLVFADGKMLLGGLINLGPAPQVILR